MTNTLTVLLALNRSFSFDFPYFFQHIINTHVQGNFPRDILDYNLHFITQYSMFRACLELFMLYKLYITNEFIQQSRKHSLESEYENLTAELKEEKTGMQLM